MNFDPKVPKITTSFSYTFERPKPKQHDVIFASIGAGRGFSSDAQKAAIIVLSNAAANVNVSFGAMSDIFAAANFDARDMATVLRSHCKSCFHEDFLNMNCFDEDNHDHGPDFDNRSWAFLEQQQIVFEKQLRNKKYIFPKINNNKLKLFKLKSMNSRSGYRGIKTIKKGN